MDAALRRAWEQAYPEPPAARAAALHALDEAAAGSAEAGWAHWLVALADLRSGAPTSARLHLNHARELFESHGLPRGLALCREIEAIAARQAGNLGQSRVIQDAIDEGPAPGYEAFDRFLAYNSRAITARGRGEIDRALSHFHDALDAAEATGWDGPRIVALANLGACHFELFNLEDARTLCEQALEAADQAGLRSLVATTAANLIVIHHAAGEPQQALASARILIDHREWPASSDLRQTALPIALAFLDNGELDQAGRWLADGADAASGADMAFRSWLEARLALARADPARARVLAEQALCATDSPRDEAYDQMELRRAAAAACEALGDCGAALAHERQAQAIYQALMGDSARARRCAMQASHAFARVERQLEVAQRSRLEAETDRRRLADLNRALEAKVAETELLHAQLREQALRDALTGLHNRRYLFEVAPGLIELARRQHQALSVVVIDLDHFKALNDGYGHGAGDAVLQRFAELMQARLRSSDVVCRYGGEEFVVVMPDQDIDGATATIERLLVAYHAERVEYRQRRLPAGTFSAGVAVFPAHGDRLEFLLGRADKALYRAKESGRARIEHATQTGFASLS